MALQLPIIIFSVALVDLTTGKAVEKHGYELVCPENEKECFVKGQEEIKEDTLIEGDILPNEEEYGESRNALISRKRKWPNATIPFIYHHKFTTEEKHFIEKQMRFIENKTCIKFVPYDQKNPADTVVMLTNGQGCVSTVGFARKQRRVLNLNQKQCLVKAGKVQHEMLHVIGLLHEHSRPDRDKYVTIITENIEPGKEHNFDKKSPLEYTAFGLPYNYFSVMHYPTTAFSKDSKSPTIVPKSKVDPKKLGQRISATKLDLKKVNLMYKC